MYEVIFLSNASAIRSEISLISFTEGAPPSPPNNNSVQDGARVEFIERDRGFVRRAHDSGVYDALTGLGSFRAAEIQIER